MARTTVRTARQQSYRFARDLGNLEALSRGPGAYTKRVVRRKAYRYTNRELARGLRRFGF